MGFDEGTVAHHAASSEWWIVHRSGYSEEVKVTTDSGYPGQFFAKQPTPGQADQRRRARQRIACSTMAATETDSPLGGEDQFEVIVPLRTRYASTVRIIAASLGADAGFTVDEIDDLRLALDEVFSMLAERHVGQRVRTTFRLDDHQLIAGFQLESGAVDVRPDELAANILRSVVDRYEFTSEAVTLTKRASEH
jgi:hypothetical protein